MSKQPHVREGGRFRGRQSGRKCGDVDESMSDHGSSISVFSYSEFHQIFQLESQAKINYRRMPQTWDDVTDLSFIFSKVL